MEEFLNQQPSLSEFEDKIKAYNVQQSTILAEPEKIDVGPVALYTGVKILPSTNAFYIPYCHICARKRVNML